MKSLQRRRMLAGLVCTLMCVASNPSVMAAPLFGANSYEAFFKALETDDDRTIRNLLHKGFDPNSVTPEGIPALSQAMILGANSSVKALLQHRDLDANQPDLRGDTPLMIAAILNQSGWVAALLGLGADLKGSGQWTALHYAATSGSIKAMQILLDAGAELNALSPNETTPLMMAARENKADAVRFLMEKGADCNKVNQSGFNAAGYAMKSGNRELALEIMRMAKQQRVTEGVNG